MPAQPIDLGTQSSPGRYPQAGVARLINLRAEAAGREGRVQYPLYAVAGLEAFVTLPGGGGLRALHATDTDMIAVADRVVCRVDAGGSVTQIGGLPSSGIVTTAGNGRASGAQTAIVCDGLYLLVESGVLSEIDLTTLAPPSSVCELGGYFWFTCPNNLFQWSELDDGRTVDGLSVATARTVRGGLVAGKARGRDLVLFGRRGSEIWTLNDGTGDVPVSFRSAIKLGALCPGGIVTVNDGAYWLATTEQGAYAGLMTLNGDTPQPVVNPAFDRIVQREASPQAITSTAWSEDGRSQIAWSGSDWTWVLDLRTGLFHERSSDRGRWRVSCTAQLEHRIIAGDRQEARLYILSQDACDEAGAELVVTLQPPPMGAFPNRIEMQALYLDVLSGVGLGAGADEDTAPTIALRLSDDGRTWSGEMRRELGRQGQTLERVAWHALGTTTHQGRSLQLSASAAVARGFFAAQADVAVLRP